MKTFNRRQFFKITGLSIGCIAATKLFGFPSAFAQGAKGALPILSPSDPVAKAVKYVEDYKKAPQAKGNHCANCSFYAKKETLGGKEVGTCLIFPGKYVYAEAYCNSWAKKA